MIMLLRIVYQSMGSVIAQLGYLEDLIGGLESIYQAVIQGRAQDARDYNIQAIECSSMTDAGAAFSRSHFSRLISCRSPFRRL